MSTAYITVVTDKGAERITAALLPDGEKLKITHFAVGDGNGSIPTPNASQTALVHEVYRGEVSNIHADGDSTTRIIVEGIIPAGQGGFWVREIGLYDDQGVLIAVCSAPERYKPTPAEGATSVLNCQVHVVVSNTSAIQLKVLDNAFLPDATTTTRGLTILSNETDSYDNYNGSTNNPGWRRCYNSKNFSVNLSSYVTESQLTGYNNNLDIIANTLVVRNGSNGGFAVWDISTTTSGANMYISPVAGINNVFRSTSSRRYKKDIENITDEQADKVLEMRPVWYRSTCEADNKDWGWYGLIAEEVGEIAPQYVHWRDATEEDDPTIVSSNGLVAEGVMYERLVVPLIKQVQKLTAKSGSAGRRT